MHVKINFFALFRIYPLTFHENGAAIFLLEHCKCADIVILYISIYIIYLTTELYKL